MRRKCIIWLMVVIMVVLIPRPAASMEADAYSGEQYLNIVTSDNRPLSVDRLLYTAFKDINFETVFASYPLRTGYDLANAGEKDGVIASTPNMGQFYPHLIQVPVQLETTEVLAVVRSDSGLTIRRYEDLAGLTVGMLEQRLYLTSQVPASASIVTDENNKAALERLATGKCDVTLIAKRSHEVLTLPPGLVFAGGQLDYLPEYLYMHEKYADLIPAMTNALSNLFKDGHGDRILNDEPSAIPASKKTVLHILSYNTEIEREDILTTKMRGVFKDDDYVDWYSISLSSRRYAPSSTRYASLAQLIRQDFVSRDVAAIVVSGKEALDFLADMYSLCFRNVPVVFYGLDERLDLSVYDFSDQMTGLYETPSAYETADLALQLFPDTQNFFVVTDFSREGLDYRAAITEQLQSFESKVNIIFNENVSRDVLLSTMRSLPPDTLVFAGSYFRDAKGQYYTKNEMTSAFEENCHVPIFNLYATNVGYGAIGGKTPDYALYGETISEMLRFLLNGGQVGDIQPVKAGVLNTWAFDKNIMDGWKISKKALPSDAFIFNDRLSIWESDPMFAVSMVAVAVLSVLVAIGAGFIYKYYKQQELLEKDKKIASVNERLERIVSTAPIVFIITVNGRIVQMNETAKSSSGLDIGGRLLDAFIDAGPMAELLDQAAQGHDIMSKVVMIQLKSKDYNRYLLNLTHANIDGKDGVVLWAVDIEELVVARQSLQMVLDTMPASVSIINRQDLRISYVNNTFIELLDIDSMDMLRDASATQVLSIDQNNGPEAADLFESTVQSILSSTLELQCRTHADKMINVRLHTHPIDYNGVPSTVCIMTDLTAEKDIERRLRNTAQEEKEANELKGRFLVNMSHEIRTPMNAIIGLTEIELRKDIPKGTRDVYKKVNMSAKNLLNIINDILDLSKIEADKIELYEDEFELEEVLGSAILVVTPRLDGKNVECLLNQSIDLPRFMVGDRTRLWQILKNFLDNAAKYTEQGKIVMMVTENTAKSNEQSIYLNFTIEDTGIGMDDEQMKKIFMPYAQIYNEAQKRYTGTGLGLVISKQLCELMGGEMHVESYLGIGTTIRLCIPFRRSQKFETERQALSDSSLENVNMLLVDDDELSLDIMTSLLSDSGARYIKARSGEEAMRIIFQSRNQGEFFDLILLDYMMKGMNGLETARQIQTALSTAPRLLMVTAHQRLLLNNDLEKNGISGLIEKPFVPSKFIRQIEVALGGTEKDEPEKVQPLTGYKGVHVLLCEDYALNQEVASGMFAQFGITAVIADDGKQGVEILQSGEKFDLILMDIQMPVMDGYEATKIIRADPRFDNIPIVSLTADAMRETIDKCHAMGMNDHIAKPVDFDSMNAVFKKWIPKEKRSEGELNIKTDTDPRQIALMRFRGNEKLYRKALKEFADELPDEWASLQEMTQDMVTAKQYIHKIKGAAGNLGENEIYQNALLFESSLREEQPSSRAYEDFTAASRGFKKRIAADINESENNQKEAGDAAMFQECMSSLQEALERYDLRDSTKTLNIMREKTWPMVDSNLLQRLYSLMENYDYTTALEVLDEINTSRGAKE